MAEVFKRHTTPDLHDGLAGLSTGQVVTCIYSNHRTVTSPVDVHADSTVWHAGEPIGPIPAWHLVEVRVLDDAEMAAVDLQRALDQRLGDHGCVVEARGGDLRILHPVNPTAVTFADVAGVCADVAGDRFTCHHVPCTSI